MLTSLRRHLQHEGGFTVVELLVVMVLLGAISSIVLAAVVSSLRVTADTEERVRALNELQRGTERIGRELRAADPIHPEGIGDFRNEVRVTVLRGGGRLVYRYYSEEAEGEDDLWHLREDIERYDGDGNLTQSQDGLFIADIANQATGTPLFTYFRENPLSGELEEVNCDGLTTSQCENRHATASQIRLSLTKTLSDGQDPVRIDTTFNIRNTQLGEDED